MVIAKAKPTKKPGSVASSEFTGRPENSPENRGKCEAVFGFYPQKKHTQTFSVIVLLCAEKRIRWI